MKATTEMPIDIKRGTEEALKAARYFGAEYQANPGSDRMEYLDDVADYLGADLTWKDLTREQKKPLLEAFKRGIEAEKACQ